MGAYRVALARCSTDHAPWYVIPADRKWHRDWLLTHLATETLREMNPHYPPTEFDLSLIHIFGRPTGAAPAAVGTAGGPADRARCDHF